MADAKITSLAALAADPADTDVFVIVDVSDTSMAATGTDKKLAASYLMKASGASAGATSQAQTFTNGIVGPSWKPSANSTSALQIQNAGGSLLGAYDTTNIRYKFLGQIAANSSNLFDGSGVGISIGAEVSPDTSALYIYGSSPGFRQDVARASGGFAATLLSPYAKNTTGGLSSAMAQIGILGDMATAPTAPSLIYLYFSSLASPAYNNANLFMLPSGAIGLGTGNSTPTAWCDVAASTTAIASIRIRAGTVPTAPSDGDVARGSTGFTLYNIDSGTNAVINHVIANRQSSGTPASGFGVGFAALLESSTTVDQNAGRLTFAWSTATHASRAAVGKLTAYYTSTEREAIQWVADSSEAKVGINGAPSTHGLHVTSAGGGGIKVTATTTGTSLFSSGQVVDLHSSNYTGGLGMLHSSNTSSVIQAYKAASEDADLLLNPNGGNVGIGTTSPGALLDVTGSIRGNYDTNTTSYFGRAAIGYNGSTSDVASFGHIDMNTSANIALFQTAAGESWFNCASGQNLIFGRGGFSLGQWDTSGNLHPAVDNTVDCGKSGSRWNDIWASNATIQTSDQRDKRAIKPSALGLDFVKALQPVSWIWADKGKRPHYGFIAQQVKQAMDAVGVKDFAGYIYDKETDSYSLRYNELLSPIVKALQELLQRVERLEKAN